MSKRAWKIVDWVFPVLISAAVTYLPQHLEAMRERGGWWAIAAAALVVAGRAFYQWWNTRRI